MNPINNSGPHWYFYAIDKCAIDKEIQEDEQKFSVSGNDNSFQGDSVLSENIERCTSPAWEAWGMKV